MSAAEAQLRFAADFAVFVVAGAGLVLLALRPHLLVSLERARTVAAAGFAFLAGASLAAGAGYIDDPAAPALTTVRVIGILLLVAVPLRWPGKAVGRVGFVLGLLALLVAEVVLVADDASEVSDVLRLVGAAALATSTFLAARRSIPTRIAISASATLLVVVLAVSVSLSVVLSENVEDEARRRLQATAATEAALAREAGGAAEANASLAARTFGAPGARTIGEIVNRQDTALQGSLTGFAREILLDFDPQIGPLMVLDAAGNPLAVAVAQEDQVVPDLAVLAELQGSRVVRDAIDLEDHQSQQSVVSVGGVAYGLAAAPIEPDQNLPPIGYVVVTSSLDERYGLGRLERGAGGDDGEGFALASRSGVVASAGELPAADAMRELAADTIDAGRSRTRTIDDRLLAAQPVFGSDDLVPVLAAITAIPTATLQDTREDLFQVLFLVAIGGTLLGLVVTAVVGERIGAGLGRLTVAAGEVQSGNLAVESSLDSDDELGVLSDAFDSMTGSLRRMTADLRTAAEDEARLRTRMEAVVGGMGEALVAVDANGDITDFNAAAELLTGIAARKAMGRPVAQIMRVVADDGSDLAARLGRIADEPWTSSATALHTTGLEVPVVVSAGPLRGAQNQHAGTVILLRDIRREREVERIKSELLSNISHELRTPLSPIKGYSQILRAREIPPDDVRRFANEIEKASARLERVVVQLVNFASMSAGRYEVRTEPTLVREVIDRAVTRWSERLDPEQYPIGRRVARGVPKVWLDRQAMDQALDELIDNAVKYSPDGGRIDVVVSADHHETIGAVVHVSVVDRGLGIPPDRVDVVLEDFTQADGSTTRSFGGLGLGLALVGRIVRAHGGELQLTSAEGHGTTVTMILPVGEEG